MNSDPKPKKGPEAIKRANRITRTLVISITVVAAIATYGAYKVADSMGPIVSSNGNEVGGSFRLMDSSDGTMTDTHFRGRWMLVMFGAIHCTDNACAPALMRLSTALQTVDPGRKLFAPIFVSLDPNRDLAMNLRQYALKFPARIITGTAAPNTLEAVAKEYHAPIVRHPDPTWEYTYELSPRIVIMDPQGHYAGTIETAASADEMTQRLGALVEHH